MDAKLTKQITSYFAERPEVIAVFVFGSYVAGTQRRFSDLDIGVLLDHPCMPDAGDLQIQYMTDLSRTMLIDVHPVILNKASEGLMKQIFKKGQCVLIKDRQKLAVFRMVMTARIADFEYYRKKMQAGFVKKLMKGA